MTDILDDMIARADESGRDESSLDAMLDAALATQQPRVRAVGIPGAINNPNAQHRNDVLIPGDEGYDDAKGLQDYIRATTPQAPEPYSAPSSPMGLVRMARDIATSDDPLGQIGVGIEAGRQMGVAGTLSTAGAVARNVGAPNMGDILHMASAQASNDIAQSGMMAHPGAALGNTIYQGVPSMLMMFATQGRSRGAVRPAVSNTAQVAGMGIMGVQSAGAGIQAYRAKAAEMGEEPDPLEELAAGASFATAEILFEKIGLSAAQPGMNMAIDGMAKSLLRRDVASVASTLAGVGLVGGVNMTEEQTTQLAQNLIETAWNPDKQLFEGVDEAGMQGLLQGVMMGGGGVLAGSVMRPERAPAPGEQVRRVNPAQNAGIDPNPAPPSFDDPVIQGVAARLRGEEGAQPTAQGPAVDPADFEAPEPLGSTQEGWEIFGSQQDAERYAQVYNNTADEGTEPVVADPLMGGVGWMVRPARFRNVEQWQQRRGERNALADRLRPTSMGELQTAPDPRSMAPAAAPALDPNDPVIAALAADLATRPAEAKRREPWEMTRDEFLRYKEAQSESLNPSYILVKTPSKKPGDIQPPKRVERKKLRDKSVDLSAMHRYAVAMAIRSGKIKSHPDYPELSENPNAPVSPPSSKDASGQVSQPQVGQAPRPAAGTQGSVGSADSDPSEPPAGSVREPWQMTKAEFVAEMRRVSAERGRGDPDKQTIAFGLGKHKARVQEAISEGKIDSHPDYPELSAKPKGPAPAKAKEPWEMTRDEFVGEYKEPFTVSQIQEAEKSAKSRRDRHNRRTGPMVPPPIVAEVVAKLNAADAAVAEMRQAYRDYVEEYTRKSTEHYEAAEKAISEGKIDSHPDYPDLKPKAAKPKKPDAPETGKPFKAVGYRGRQEGATAQIEGGEFFTPDEAIARLFAGPRGNVERRDISFENPLVAQNWVEAKKAIGLDNSHDMATLFAEAFLKGHDGIVFLSHNEGVEYAVLSKPTPSNAPIESQPGPLTKAKFVVGAVASGKRGRIGVIESVLPFGKYAIRRDDGTLEEMPASGFDVQPTGSEYKEPYELSKDEFGKMYAQHINLRGNKVVGPFFGGFNVNALPIVEKGGRFYPGPEQEVFLVPYPWLRDGASGLKTIAGWIPTEGQVVRRGNFETLHEAAVAKAIEQGKILAHRDYPHLSKQTTAEEEQAVIDAYLAKHDHTKGQVPAREPYLPSRDEKFAKSDWRHQTRSAIGTNESAQEAIATGERLGYRPEDIAAFLYRNYVSPETRQPRAGDVDATIAKIWEKHSRRINPDIPINPKLMRERTVPGIVEALTGTFNDYLRPDNKVSRATFEELTGVKLPKGLAATKALFTGQPFGIVVDLVTGATGAPVKPKFDTSGEGKPGAPLILDMDDDGGTSGAPETNKERDALIERIVVAARRPLLPIEERRKLKGSDGNWYGANGFPIGVKHTGETRPDGFVQTREGVDVGQRYNTREEAEAAQLKVQKENDDAFRTALREMDDAALAEQQRYWLKEDPASLPPPGPAQGGVGGVSAPPPPPSDAPAKPKPSPYTPGASMGRELREIAAGPETSDPALLREWADFFEAETVPMKLLGLADNLRVVANANNQRRFGVDASNAIIKAIETLRYRITSAGKTTTTDPKSKPLPEAIADFFVGGGTFKTIVEARKFVAEHSGGEKAAGGTMEAKTIEEAIEHGVVLAARQIIDDMKGQPETAVFARLESLYQQQPNLSTRTGQSMLLQAYSTPVPLAYVVARLARTETASAVYEPTAGTGMLLIDSDPSRTTANELDTDRAAILKAQGFAATSLDGATTGPAEKSIDAVVGNPPFGTVPKPGGGNMRWTLGTQGRTDQIDHAIVQRSLESMTDDGRAVFVVGSKREMATGAPAYDGKSAPFYRWLYAHYNVTDHFTISGDLYTKQGAGFPVDVLVIEGRGRSQRPLPAAVAPRVYDSWAVLGSEVLDEDRSTGAPAKAPVRGGGGGSQGTGGTQPRPVLPPVVRAPQGDGSGRKPKGGSRGPATTGAPAGSGTASANPAGTGGSTDVSTADGVRVDAPDQTGANNQPDGSQGVSGNDAGTVDTSGIQGAVTDVAEEGTQNQVPYKASAKDAVGVGTVIPKSQAEAVAIALEQLKEDAGGDVPEFIGKEMGWTRPQVLARLSAEQIDMVGLAIVQAKNDNGLVVGDQTGVGKGRVVAAMLVWANRNGRLPVFVTQDTKLYGDMLRDLEDIGFPSAKLLPTNQDLKGKSAISTANGNKVATIKDYHEKIQQMYSDVRAGRPTEFLAVATTYSQFFARQVRKAGSQAPTRRELFLQIADQSFFVLDESHNAGGSGLDENEMQHQAHLPLDEQKGAFYVRSLLQRARSVMYSSATWAKRPDTMSLYAKTDLRHAVDNIAGLGEAIKRGGVALQQIVSSELVKLGQYLRRERSFAGVEYRTDVVEANREQVSGITDIYSRIVSIDGLVKNAAEKFIETLPDVTMEEDESTGTAGAESTTFSSQLNNAISQMNLSAKTNAAADYIIERIKSGEKVVVALENTMQSLIEATRADEGASFGDPAEVTFKNRLERYLARSLQVRYSRPNDDGGFDVVTETIPEQFWGPELHEAVLATRTTIANLNVDDMPVSPIDWLLYRLRSAGIRVGEITGRSETVEYQPDGSAIYKARGTDEQSKAGQRRVIDGFQNGEIDVVILNASGATGISLHADGKRAKDLKPRRMVILQPIRNIDVFMQALGRIHRTGQVVKPRYTMLVSDIPSEKRPGSLLQKKMASLNANVSSARGGDVTFDAPDLFNIVGDAVVERWMNSAEGMGWIQGIGGMFRPDETLPEPNESDPGAFAQKVTGRMSILPLEAQEEIWRTLGDAFNNELALLSATGENPLEVNIRDLRAKTIKTLPFMESRTGPRSWFTSPAWFEKIEAKLNAKPSTFAELKAETQQYLEGKSWEQQTKERLDRAREYFKNQIAAKTFDDADKRAEWIGRQEEAFVEFRTVLARMEPGYAMRHNTIGTFYIRRVAERDSTKNPMALSRFRVEIVFPDERPPIWVGYNMLEGVTDDAADSVGMEVGSGDAPPRTPEQEFDDFAADPLMRRWVIKGNLLQAWERLAATTRENNRGIYTLTYTSADGSPSTGIVLPRNVTDEWIEGLSQQRSSVLRDQSDAARVLKRFDAIELVDSSKTLIVRGASRGEDFEAILPPDRRSSVRFLAMRDVAKAAGGDFVRSKGQQVLAIPAGKLQATLDAFANAGVVFVMQGRKDTTVMEFNGSRQMADAIKEYGVHSAAGGAGGDTGTPGQRAGTSLLDRMDTYLAGVRARANARMEARAKKRGTYLGMNRADPRDMTDSALYLTALAAQGGVKVVKGGRALSKFIAANIDKIKSFDAKPHAEAITRISRAMLKGAVGADGTINQKALADNYVAATRKETKQRDANLQDASKAPVVQARAESEATSRAAAKAIQKQVKRAVSDTWRQAIAQWKLDATNLVRQARSVSSKRAALAGFEARVDKAGALERQQARFDTIEGLRKEVARLAEELPAPVRANFLNAATSITTELQLVRTINRMRRSFNRWEARQYAKALSKMTKAKKLKPLTNERKEQIKEIMGLAELVWQSTRKKDVSADKLRTAADALRGFWEDAKAIFTEDALERKAIKGLRGKAKWEAVEQVVEDVKAAHKKLKAKPGKDANVNFVVSIERGLEDVRNVVESLEGRPDGVLQKLMWHMMELAEEAFFTGLRGDIQRLEVAVRKVGFKSLSDAMNKLGNAQGEANRIMVEERLGGNTLRMGLGDILELIAASQDPSTMALLEKGMPIQWDGGLFQDPMNIDADDIVALWGKYNKYQPLIDGIRRIYERQRPLSFRVFRILKGFVPTAYDNYWPRRRNLQAAEGTTQMESLEGDWLNRKLENAGFGKDRGKSPTAPMVIGNIMDSTLQHIEDVRLVIHMAIPTRNAADVLYAPQVRATIGQRFGAKWYTRLEMMLAHASRANRVHGTAAARFVAKLSSNLAVARLATNPPSALVQSLSVIRFAQFVPMTDITWGVANLRKISIDEIMKKSGYAWDRYTQEAFARFSPVVGKNMMSESGFWKNAGAAGRNAALAIRRRDKDMLWDAIRVWRTAGQNLMVFMNQQEALAMRALWMALRRQANREHPNWEKGQRDQWIATQLRLIFRETQNGSSPLDSSIAPTLARDSAAASIFMFTSDLMKSRNRIIRAFRRSKAEGIQAATLEAINILAANSVRASTGFLIAAAVVGAMGGDWEDMERLAEQFLSITGLLQRSAKDLVGTGMPIVTQWGDSIIRRPYDENAPTLPAQESVSEIIMNVGSATRQVWQAAWDEDKELDAMKFIKALEKGVSESAALAGANPFQAMYRRVMNQTWKELEGDEE